MNNLTLAIIYAAFFGCIAFACYITDSAIPLLALIFTPSYTTDNDNE